MTDKTLTKRLELIGGAAVFAIASLLHFLYDLTERSILGSLFGSVNESVWEHMKIFAIAYLFWAIIELLWTKPPLTQFVWGKALGLYFLCIGIAAVFFIYTPIVGRPILLVDLISSFLLSVLAHHISYKVTFMKENNGQCFYVGIMMIFLALVMIVCFTYYPPKTPLFQDYTTGLYGIIPESSQPLSDSPEIL